MAEIGAEVGAEVGIIVVVEVGAAVGNVVGDNVVRVGVGDGARDTDGKNEGVLDGDVVVGANDPVVMRATQA